MTLVAFTAAALALAGCSSGGNSDSSPPAGGGAPVKVGLVFPQTGPSGPDGARAIKAVQVMADMINEKGGVLGRPIQLVTKDDQSTPAIGVAKANELLADDPSLVIEGWNSGVTLAMQPVFAEAGVLDITAVAKSDDVLSGKVNPYAIRLNSSNSQDGAPIADILVNKLKAKRLAFMPENDAFGDGATRQITAAATKLDPTIQVVAVEKYPLDQTDFRTVLANVAAAKPDAVVGINSAQASGWPALIKQYREAGLTAPLLSSTAGLPPATIDAAGPAADGVMSADTYLATQPPFDTDARSKEFIARHKQATGQDPQPLPTMAAASLDVWAQAVTKTNSLDRKTVAEAIRGKSFDDSVIGPLTFGPDGQRQVKYLQLKVQGGQLALLDAAS